MTNKLVTLVGGGGFIGRYTAQALLRAGARVRIAQRDPRQAWFLKTQGGLGQTQFVGADLLKPDSILRAIEGADAVVNLVGVLEGKFHAIHVTGARNVAAAAAQAGCSAMVQISAIGADPHSDSAYAQSKGDGEQAVREAFPAATILRPSIVFGREDEFVNRFAGMIAKLPILPIVRPGTKFQPVYVADVADAIVAALADPGLHGGRTYELGGPEIITMAGLHHWIADAIGRNPSFIELPDSVGSLLASLPGTPISQDQWRMLGHDNVVGEGEPGLKALGIEPTPLAAVAPAWLVRYRKLGRFGLRARAA